MSPSSGAIAASVIGVDARVGLFALTLAAGRVLAGLGRRAQADDTAIGLVFAWILGVGLLLLIAAGHERGGAPAASPPSTRCSARSTR